MRNQESLHSQLREFWRIAPLDRRLISVTALGQSAVGAAATGFSMALVHKGYGDIYALPAYAGANLALVSAAVSAACVEAGLRANDES